jgi:hypothetical protein
MIAQGEFVFYQSYFYDEISGTLGGKEFDEYQFQAKDMI